MKGDLVENRKNSRRDLKLERSGSKICSKNRKLFKETERSRELEIVARRVPAANSKNERYPKTEGLNLKLDNLIIRKQKEIAERLAK